MSNSLEILALRKQVLLARSTFCRLRIRHELNALHQSRVARSAALVTRILPFASLISVAFRLLRKIAPGK